MKILLLCLILSVMVVIASGRNEHQCQKGDAEITTIVSCILSNAPGAHTQALGTDLHSVYSTSAVIDSQRNAKTGIKKLMDSMIKTLGCADIVCATRKVCDQGNLDETLKKYFPDPVIDILHELAESCDQQAPQGRH